MNLSNYPLSAEDDLTTFEFISEGPKGLIRKLVQFTPTNLQGFYILAFGDKDNETGQIDDLAISNNNDTEKILATVVQRFTLLVTNIHTLGFMQQAVQKHGHDFTE